jgi:hypothetical protein
MAKQRKPVAAETVQELAGMLVEYRLGGCRDGAATAVMLATKKAASKHGVPYSELWAIVHKAAYEIIDADSRSSL